MIFAGTDNQLWRRERVAKVAKVAAKILGMTEEQMDALIVGMYDSKGHLVVVWNDFEPTKVQELAFGTAWSLSGENETSVTHEHSAAGIERWV